MMILPSVLAQAGMPYQVLGDSSAATVVTVACTRSANAVLRCHLRDLVEHRLQRVGLLGALLALGAQLGRTLLSSQRARRR